MGSIGRKSRRRRRRKKELQQVEGLEACDERKNVGETAVNDEFCPVSDVCVEESSSRSCKVQGANAMFQVEDFGILGFSRQNPVSTGDGGPSPPPTPPPPAQPTSLPTSPPPSPSSDFRPSFSSKLKSSRSASVQVKKTLRTRLEFLQQRRRKKHQECKACMFVENSVSKNCNEYERLSKSVKFLIDEKKILSLHTVWRSEEEGKL